MFHALKRTRSSYCCCGFSTHRCCCSVLSTHRHQSRTTVKHTQSVSVPIRHPSDKRKLWILTSFVTRQIYTSQIQYARYINTRYTHACGVCGLFTCSMAGLLAFSSRQFALTMKYWPRRPLHLTSHYYFPFLSKRSGRRIPHKQEHFNTDLSLDLVVSSPIIIEVVTQIRGHIAGFVLPYSLRFVPYIYYMARKLQPFLASSNWV